MAALSNAAGGLGGTAGDSSAGVVVQPQRSRSEEVGLCVWQHVQVASGDIVRFAQQHAGALVDAVAEQAHTGSVCQPAHNVAATVSRHRSMRVGSLIKLTYVLMFRPVKGTCAPRPAYGWENYHPERLESAMPKLTVEGVGTFDVPPGKRLVLALEDEAKIDQLHACGGNARCTTCRVEFIAGEPPTMTEAERQVLAARGLTGVRLSCQILTDHDMTVRAISRLAGSGRKDAGPRPADTIPT